MAIFQKWETNKVKLVTRKPSDFVAIKNYSYLFTVNFMACF